MSEREVEWTCDVELTEAGQGVFEEIRREALIMNKPITWTDEQLGTWGPIIQRLEALERRFSEQGINDLARVIEARIVSRMKYGRDPHIEVKE